MEYLPGGSDYILTARHALALINWRWFPGCEVVRKRDQQLLSLDVLHTISRAS
jgi:hypothetical protein